MLLVDQLKKTLLALNFQIQLHYKSLNSAQSFSLLDF